MSNSKFDKVFVVGEETDEFSLRTQSFRIFNHVDENDVGEELEKIRNGLKKPISIADLSKIGNMSDFVKIQIAYAIGRLRQSQVYGGVASPEILRSFYYKDGRVAYRGLAVVDGDEIKGYYYTSEETA